MTALALSIAAAFAGCATAPERYDAGARATGFAVDEIAGAGFRHRVYRNVVPASAHVRVYFEGDGTPWQGGRTIAAEPTARRPFALELMRRDEGAAMLLGRPCYHGYARDPGCTPRLWTDARYGEEVVASLAVALDRLLAFYPGASATLIGYSGGGVLARLVAERVPAVDRVITVAANLDVAAWTRLHGYLPLDASIDPARSLPPRRPFAEVDLVGGRDKNVPPAIVASYAAVQRHARVELLDDYDHVCCWVDAWPQLLRRFDP